MDDRIDEWMKRAFGMGGNKEVHPKDSPAINLSQNSNKPNHPQQAQQKNKGPTQRPQVQGRNPQQRFNAPRPQPNAPRPQVTTQRPQVQGRNPQQRFNAPRPQPNAPRPQVTTQRPQVQGRNPQQRFNAPRPQPNAPRPQVQPQKPQSQRPQPQAQNERQAYPALKGELKIIPIGGLDEVGKNMTIFEYENDIIIVDMGLEFPGEELLGVDYVIPDVKYLEKNKKKIRGVFITHGHLDHTGGIPYILPKLDFPPIYSLPLTIGLIEERIKEFKIQKFTKLHKIKSDEKIKLGNFSVSFFRVAHSIPDAMGIIIDTPAGKIVTTGDFKFDETPPRNMQMAEVHKIAELGKQNVLALLCESTNATKPGHTISEKDVGEVLDGIIAKAKGRIIVASFSSQIGRVQQILDSAVKNKRKVFVSGRSMKTNIEISEKLGYLSMPKGLVIDIKKYKEKEIRDEEALILTTGAQGEASASLSRMAGGEHSQYKVKKGDLIIVSASPIIGNERSISNVINKLCMLGAEVIHTQIMEVHTSGHAKQDELKQMINLINPKYLIPIHGEFFMRQALANLAIKDCGIPEQAIIMLQNGDVLATDAGKIKKTKEKVETNYILIDGSGEGQIDSQVIIDRQIMSENGALLVLVYVSAKDGKLTKEPDVVSRGLVYPHELSEITKEISKIAATAYTAISAKKQKVDRKEIKNQIKRAVEKSITKRLDRRPLIVPLIIEQ
ncbi:ribonuclease J [Candidatus Peregrinibacteria bacterium CG_4_10_14_0_2_um_filter_38_24]|nr:MAG: ribonuclease J [Candidatus Peregrinibacteria bacterium CG_4_10_14_0_2_um_filter_38_24]PJC38977.1 MAG: ribonuclease J [Candidatus Peregrinibacteria bacterium CG_4_9_14_0_2_um_filter_38_9]